MAGLALSSSALSSSGVTPSSLPPVQATSSSPALLSESSTLPLETAAAASVAASASSSQIAALGSFLAVSPVRPSISGLLTRSCDSALREGGGETTTGSDFLPKLTISALIAFRPMTEAPVRSVGARGFTRASVQPASSSPSFSSGSADGAGTCRPAPRRAAVSCSMCALSRFEASRSSSTSASSLAIFLFASSSLMLWCSMAT
mmetsp:Transcript_12946/g.51661  ORF Transcript_12946/g.51661 Transcript_12946/m.51661 type:complete len:204 (+) Transcript_12946:410-1021(+)